ncbi:HD domain-containing protein [Streptomyces sp. NBC_00358]|jgi:predicted metal-dependent HD superfamily phosphohydrolase|uniref:HD domain-containing protein n=1 Tax=Streptomyces sp. NBC_00358 TaxID=2975725 RepID=UPI002E25768A
MAAESTRHPAHAELAKRWADTVLAARSGGSGPSPDPYAANLLDRWAEPRRRYHTTDHLLAVLDRIDVLEAHGEHAEDPAAVRLAAWFHDAVYLPDRSENEERSARLAERALAELGVGADRTAEVARLVRLTVSHDPADGDTDGAVLCDADLAILASPPAGYAAYTAAVREEYAFVPDDAFRVGRAAVMRQLLDLPRLFRTPYGERVWAEPARRNMRDELAALTRT